MFMIRQFKNPMRLMRIISNIKTNKLLIELQNQWHKREMWIKQEQNIEHKHIHKESLFKKLGKFQNLYIVGKLKLQRIFSG